MTAYESLSLSNSGWWWLTCNSTNTNNKLFTENMKIDALKKY
jgi:hypothetical protein